MTTKRIPMQFPYGAVYFRKSNPPRDQWERDYAQAAEDGMNIFRHWFMWGSIETAPGQYDWHDYDEQLRLAEKYGLKTIIAEFSRNVPEWLAAQHPELLYTDANGQTEYPRMGVSPATGGFNSGLCLHKPRGYELTHEFLRKLAEHYKGHPALLGYDVENECCYYYGVCYCQDTDVAFQKWLRKKYGDLKTLGDVWHRYSYTDWSQIRHPSEISFYPDAQDWLDFNTEDFNARIQKKIDTLRSVDTDAVIAAHGVASSFSGREKLGCDDWSAASKVEVFGTTWIPARHGNQPFRQFGAIDLLRAASRETPFWHAEMQGGPLWLQPQLTGRTKDDARVASTDDIRLWHLTSLACGARGVLYLRWRPLLDGPLFDAFGPYGIDGLPTDRSRMASSLAKWTNAPGQADLMAAKCVKSEIGILYMPESGTANYLLPAHGKFSNFSQMIAGAYQGFFDNNIQADFVHIDDIDTVKALYFPYPVCVNDDHAEKLKAWVRAGGTLIAEACPAFFGSHLHMGQVQPNLGFDEVFGCRQVRAEFMPDILTDIQFRINGTPVGGEGYLQTYQPTTGSVYGTYEGEAIAVHNHYGNGKTILVGAMLSGRYGRVHDEGTRSFFAWLPEFCGIAQTVSVADSRLKARVQKSEAATYLWLINSEKEAIETVVSLPDGAVLGEVLWKGGEITDAGRGAVRVGARDGLAVRLRGGATV